MNASLRRKDALAMCVVLLRTATYCAQEAATPPCANERIATLRGHASWVRRLIVHNNILYSGGNDEAIRAWKL